MILNNLGVLYCDVGNYETAQGYHEQAIGQRHTIGDIWGEAQSMTNLGLVYQGLGNQEEVQIICERALQVQRDIGDRRMIGYSLTYLGHTLTGLNNLEAAETVYGEAMRLRRELGQHSLAIDDLAGLAQIALAQNKAEQALAQAEEILAWIETNGTDGIEYPLQVYLTCYQILNKAANGDATAIKRADTILSAAYTSLMEQAAGISDETLRRSFLENVNANKNIVAAWEAK